TTTSTTPSQQQPGWAKGSVGYTSVDCIALVAPDQYKKYATANYQLTHEVNPLKYVFQALATHSKPTSNPNFPTYLHKAK
ncbi:hypothetical protein VP01_5552g1, partial [Puccinia sorghi]